MFRSPRQFAQPALFVCTPLLVFTVVIQVTFAYFHHWIVFHDREPRPFILHVVYLRHGSSTQMQWLVGLERVLRNHGCCRDSIYSASDSPWELCFCNCWCRRRRTFRLLTYLTCQVAIPLIAQRPGNDIFPH
ncbi:hypothetical protein F4861DRAFT_53094 [Xylaria intraflava]|nr:hypothetical protein F4861DRAFT_53094 [Xylaria intraflava]